VKRLSTLLEAQQVAMYSVLICVLCQALEINWNVNNQSWQHAQSRMCQMCVFIKSFVVFYNHYTGNKIYINKMHVAYIQYSSHLNL
jgi:hypothetical protein